MTTFFICLFVVFAITQAAFAKTIHVKTDGSDGVVGNTSWTAPYKTVTKALDMAILGDEIWDAAGTYDEGAPITMKNGVFIFGDRAIICTHRQA